MKLFGNTPGTAVLEGCRIRYFRLGQPGQRPLMLVHGGGAHSGWWSAVAPILGSHYDLLIPDLSGHGDSEHREHYSGDIWASELVELARLIGWHRFSLVGHSMGGKIGVFVASRGPGIIDQLVMVDSAFRRPGEPAFDPSDRPRPQHKISPTLGEAVARFRLRPGDTTADPELLTAVARYAVAPVPGGWTWKFDPSSRQQITNEALHQELPHVRCRISMIHGARSPLTGPDTLAYLRERLPHQLPAISIPDAYHHVPLDQPQLCAAAIQTLLTSRN